MILDKYIIKYNMIMDEVWGQVFSDIEVLCLVHSNLRAHKKQWKGRGEIGRFYPPKR